MCNFQRCFGFSAFKKGALGNDNQTCCQVVCPLIFVLENKGEKKLRFKKTIGLGWCQGSLLTKGSQTRLLALPFIPLNYTNRWPMPGFLTQGVEIITSYLIWLLPHLCSLLNLSVLSGRCAFWGQSEFKPEQAGNPRRMKQRCQGRMVAGEEDLAKCQ